MQFLRSDHVRVDERSLALHRLVAGKLLADPALLDLARDNIRRWQAIGGNSPALEEWEDILRGPAVEVAELLSERSQRANRLRQSSPFAGVLTDAERQQIHESYAARTYHPGREPDFG